MVSRYRIGSTTEYVLEKRHKTYSGAEYRIVVTLVIDGCNLTHKVLFCNKNDNYTFNVKHHYHQSNIEGNMSSFLSTGFYCNNPYFKVSASVDEIIEQMTDGVVGCYLNDNVRAMSP